MDDPDVLKLQKMLTDIAQSKPPVSKATIVEVSKAALTAIRHFKHVVHLIEKFILKCKSYHKLFGVYMIDSIVRQAQKKFKHKDVFGPRFAVNLRQTLENALTCPAKERPKIVRLLNLWSANNIFEEDTLRPLLQHCRASGLDVDAESVEKAVKGEKADMTRYGAGGLNISPMKAVSASVSAVASAPSNSSSLNPAAFILKLLSSVNSDYDKVFSSNSRAFRKVQDLLTENVKKHLSSQSKNKIQNILSAEFDYSDDESGDENKTAVDITAIPQEQIDKTIESLVKNSKILDEIRSIYYENGGNDLHGSSSSKYDDRDRKRKRSRSSSRDKTSDRKRERSRRSKERERSRSHRRRSSSPPRHRDDKRDKERRKLGLPTDPKKEHLIIGSRTLWLGRLPQNCQENQIRNAMEEFGTIERIQVIQSKICAYVTMSDRRTAYKIIDKMSNKIEISRKFIKVSWATGQGLKDDNKLNVFWDAENGFHEIPWSSLPHRIGHLFEGGSVDLDTIPPKFKGMYDEKGKVIKPKSPERISEQPQQPNLSHVPLPPPENPIVQPPQNFQPPPPQNFQPPSSMPTAVPPPMPIPNFQPGILPPGLNKDASANIEMLMAVVANGNNNNQPGILGPPPSTFNPALMNALNAAANVRTQLANLNRPPFPRHEGPLPDQQAAFQQFRGANPQRTFGNDFNNPGGFKPQIRTGFNNGNGFALPDMSNPPPNMGMNNPLPNMGERAPPMNFNIPPPIMNFAQPPPNLNLNPTQAEHQEEPMDIASPDGPPGV